LHKGRNKNPIAKSGSNTLPQYLQVKRFKLRYKKGIFYKDQKEKGLIINDLDVHDPKKRIEELEYLLNHRYTITALPFLRIQYIAQGKIKEAAEVKTLFNRIIKVLREPNDSE